MNLMDALRGRRSIRRYLKGPVTKEMARALVEAGETAPSAGNLRARRYFVVTKPDIRKALAMAAYGQHHVESAPLLIVVCADLKRSSSRYGDRGGLYSIQDATASVMCLLLAAHDMGLGACWSGAFDEEIVKEALSLEDHILPVAIISLGWPGETPSPPPRRQEREILSWIE